MNNELMRLEEVAVRLNISYMQTWRIVNSGQLKSIRVGERGIRVEQAELDQYMKKLKKEGGK